jgi:hypothetical protein
MTILKTPFIDGLWKTIYQARPAAVAHFASSSARLSFPTPISLDRRLRRQHHKVRLSPTQSSSTPST